jgi:hypothetical protein
MLASEESLDPYRKLSKSPQFQCQKKKAYIPDLTWPMGGHIAGPEGVATRLAPVVPVTLIASSSSSPNSCTTCFHKAITSIATLADGRAANICTNKDVPRVAPMWNANEGRRLDNLHIFHRRSHTLAPESLVDFLQPASLYGDAIAD